MHESICVNNKRIPIIVFPNIVIPTVPIINSGPELLVKLKSLSHSDLEQIFSSLNLQAILAPTGYPLISPIIKAKEPAPFTLKRGFIINSNFLPKCVMIFVCINNSVATKNGNNDGTTEFA